MFQLECFPQRRELRIGQQLCAELLPDSILKADGHSFPLGRERNCQWFDLQRQCTSVANRTFLQPYLFPAASAGEDAVATFSTGNNSQEITVPSYTGFIGQWEHLGHTEGFLKDAEIAYVGTHRHASDKDEAYEFTYMFKFGMVFLKERLRLLYRIMQISYYLPQRWLTRSIRQ